MPESRYFYHSFPRRGESDDDHVHGLAILSSVLRSGLLLTPELIPLREGLVDGTSSEIAILQQKRICFTELAPSELAAHAETFGLFALEWELATLPAMGACPVFYVPLVESSDDLSGVGAAMLMRLGEAQAVLERLEVLAEAVSDMPPEQLLVVTKDGETQGTTRMTAGGGSFPADSLYS